MNFLGKSGALKRNWQAPIWLLFLIMRKYTLVSLSKGMNSSSHIVFAQKREMYPERWSSSTLHNARTTRAVRHAMRTGTPQKWGSGWSLLFQGLDSGAAFTTSIVFKRKTRGTYFLRDAWGPWFVSCRPCGKLPPPFP